MIKLRDIVGIAALLALGGCASSDNLNSWQGHSAQELLSTMGEPAERVSLQDGGQEISYQHAYQRNPNRGAATGSLGRAAGGATASVCTVIYRTDPQGTIVGADTGGNFNACNDYLETVSAAQ